MQSDVGRDYFCHRDAKPLLCGEFFLRGSNLGDVSALLAAYFGVFIERCRHYLKPLHVFVTTTRHRAGSVAPTYQHVTRGAIKLFLCMIQWCLTKVWLGQHGMRTSHDSLGGYGWAMLVLHLAQRRRVNARMAALSIFQVALKFIADGALSRRDPGWNTAL